MLLRSRQERTVFDFEHEEFFNPCMDLRTSVLIISAYGRGNWLAAELHRENIPVVVIDVTSKLGSWPPEDIEGPFGFFSSENITSSQSERVFSGDSYESVDDGFTVWLSDGPIEFKSPVTEYRLKVLGQNVEVCDLLRGSKAVDKNKYAIAKWASDNFFHSWVLQLAHQFAATTFVSNAKASLQGKALHLMNPFFVRKATRAGQQKAMDWLLDKKVELLQKTEILDISFHNKKYISGLELQGERAGVLHFQQLVWTLSSEESYFVNPKVAKHFFPKGILEPEWCWVRYRMKFSSCQEIESLPLHLIVIDEVGAPWSHQNLIVLQRTALENHFDAWIRIPNVQRFNKEYLRIRGEKIVAIMGQRLPISLPEIQSFPQEFYYAYSQIGPAIFPVYQEKFSRGKSQFNNLFQDGPEVWMNYLWGHQFECQQVTRDSLVKWWELIQMRKERESRD